MACEASAPSARRCSRETVLIFRLDRKLSRKNSGNTTTITSASCQSMKATTTTIATSVTVFPSSGSAAVTATSFSRPTSLVTRVTRSPVRARSW